MSKNLTRKGLAFGALIALGSTVIAGTPASAADLSLAPSLGTTYSVLLGDTFTLNSAVSGNTNIGNTTAWKWEIVNTSGVTVVPTATSWVTNAYAAAALTTSDTGTTKVYTPATVTSAIGKVNTLTLNPTTTSTTATFSVTVRSFSDLDASGSVTAGDLVSDAKTVTFVKGSEVTGTVALDDVNAGVAPTATLTLNKDINVEQTTLPTVAFSTNGATGVAGTVAVNTAKTGFDLTAAGTASANQNITATAKWLNYDGDTVKTSATSGGNTSVAASTATAGSVTIANSANIATAAAGDFSANALPTAGITAQSKKNVIVRSGTKSVTFTVAMKDTNAVLVPAGQPATVTVAETGADKIASATVISASTKKITGSDSSSVLRFDYYTKTDAAGNVTVTVNSNNATAGDEIVVTVTAGTGAGAVGIVWKDAVATSVKELSEPAGNTTRVIKTGGSVALSYRLQDQFGEPFTKADYSYRLALTASAGAITISQPIVSLANGVGSATIVENDPAGGATFTVLATAYSQTGTGAWTSLSLSKSSVVSVVDAVAVPKTIELATAVLGDLSAIAGTGVPLAAADPIALDLRFNANSGTAAALTAITGSRLFGTVTQANGSVAAGVAVTVAAAGVAFSTESNGATYVSPNSITVYTAADGTYTVYAFSKKSGAITITHTSGAATKTQSVTWAKPAVTSGAALTIVAPALVKAGRTVPVTVNLLDKYGNGIDTAAADGLVTVTVSGPGFTTTVADNTNASGQIKFNVILGSSDFGAITVTADYDSNGATANVTGSTVVLASTKSTLVGVSATVTAGKKLASVVVKNAEGLSVDVVSGAKSREAVATSDNFKTSLTKLSAGKHTVKVYVNDVLVSSKLVTVKK